MIRISDIPNLEGYGVFVDDLEFKNLSRRDWDGSRQVAHEQTCYDHQEVWSQ